MSLAISSEVVKGAVVGSWLYFCSFHSHTSFYGVEKLSPHFPSKTLVSHWVFCLYAFHNPCTTY